jgi:uncharacterized protein
MLVAILLASVVGVSLGLLGGGGSILTLPILRYVLGMDAHRAIALSLFVVASTSVAAMIPHARRGKVRWRVGALFGAAGMVGAYGAGRVAWFIPDVVLLVGFAVMMLVTAVAMLRGRSDESSGSGPRHARSPEHQLSTSKVLVEGMAVGAVTGLVGAGGGFLVVPALALLGGLPMDVAIGTSLLVIAMKSSAGLAGFIGHTQIDWILALAISASAVSGSVVGGLLSGKVSGRALREGFGWFVVAMGLFTLAQELPEALGADASLAVAVLVSAAGTLTAFLVKFMAGRVRQQRLARSV